VGLGKEDLRASCALGEPDMPHGGEVELSENNLMSRAEGKGAGEGIDAGRGAGDQGHVFRLSADKLGEAAAAGLVMLDPNVPGRAIPVPASEVLEHGGFYFPGERSLRATVQVKL